jgi:hypothetical protein
MQEDEYNLGGLRHEYDIYHNDDNYMDHTFELTFKKLNPFSFTEGKETFALKVNLNTKHDNNSVTIVLERLTGSSRPPPSFTFKGELVTTLQIFEDPQILNNITEDKGSRKYNFNLGSNSDTFKKIIECLRNLETNLQRLQYSP